MHQLFHDAAAAFTYLGAAIMAAFMLYVIFYVPFARNRYDDD